MPERDIEFENAVHGVVQGNPGAMKALYGIRESMPFEDYQAIVLHCYERGPRGVGLWEQFHDRCGEDALILGHDLLALAGEWRGWDDDDDQNV